MIVGIIGCGGIAKAYVRALSLMSDIKELVLYDINVERAAQLGMESKVPATVVTDICNLSNQSDGFIVCTPNNLHLPVIEEVVRNNFIPCVCEKPLADKCASAYRIHQIAHPLSIVSFNYRYNNVFRNVDKVITSTSMGDMHYFSAEFNKNSAMTRGYLTWRDSALQCQSSGALGDLSCHLLDLFCVISSQHISLGSVRVSKGTRVPMKSNGAVEVDDNGYVFGTGDRGAIFRIRASKSESREGLGLHLNLVFERGEIQYSSRDPKKIFVHKFAETDITEFTIDDDHLLADPEKEVPFWSDSFFYMLKDWFRELHGVRSLGSLPRISSGLHIQQVMDVFQFAIPE